MRPTIETLRKYANLLVRKGANVQKGQVVTINASVDQHAFACLVMEECYLAGAKKVNIDWGCDQQTRLNFTYADEDVLGTTLVWEEEKLKQMVEDLPCRIFIESEDPDALAGLDVEKLSRVTQKRAKVRKPYRNAIDGRHQWLIAAIPSAAWAKKCFPDHSEEEAMELLWDAILRTVRVEENNDPLQEWQKHIDFMAAKADWLNNQKLRSLRYSSSNGTDFTVDLIPEAKWEAANDLNITNNTTYIPNMPTEEVFTTPMAGKCEGTLVAVKPLSWNGQLIEDFSITFEDGKAVSCKAAKGQELLEKMLHMDEKACMLGEVALVPKESPVNQCGFLFYNTLFDENACCHVAIGAGFKEVLPNGEHLSAEEAEKMGINDSIIHVDFMVGADDLHIVGIREDGSEVDIFINGTYV
ncbi:MAG: aminopeptidase [Blautia sp.]|nr:aminopeptidase [Blautia sp.]